MSKRSRTHWYISEEDSIIPEQKSDRDVAGTDRKDSCHTDKSLSLEDMDEVDGWFGEFLPKFKPSGERLQHKLSKYESLILEQRRRSEENVSKYLEVAQGNIDKYQLNKMKSNFEKVNLRCSQNIDCLTRKKEACMKMLLSLNQPGDQCVVSSVSGSSKRLRNNVLKKVRSPSFPYACLSSGNTDVKHSDNKVLDMKKCRLSRDNLNMNGPPKLSIFLVTRCKSKSEENLSRRDGFNLFPEEENDFSKGSNSIKKNINVDESFKDFLLAKQKLNELNGNTVQLADSILGLQIKLEHIQQDGKKLQECQKKRTILQRNMFELLEKQHEAINAIRKELHVMEEKIELKVSERSMEIKEAVESCQYQTFQLEHGSPSHEPYLVPRENISTKSIGWLAIKAMDHLLTLISTICMFLATTASMLQQYQLNASRPKKIWTFLVLVGTVCTFLVCLNFVWKRDNDGIEL